MGFLRDLFGPRQPCDLCHLGRVSWPPARNAAVDWQVFGHGMNARLSICAPCRSLVLQADLMQKTPMLAMAHLVALKHAHRPPVHAYLQHSEWRKVWMHLLETSGIDVVDEFSAMAAMKPMEAAFMRQVGGETSAPVDLREGIDNRAAATPEQVGLMLAFQAAKSAFAESGSLLDRLRVFSPKLEDDVGLRSELLAFCLVPYVVVVRNERPEWRDLVPPAMTAATRTVLRAMFAQPDDLDVDWDSAVLSIDKLVRAYASFAMSGDEGVQRAATAAAARIASGHPDEFVVELLAGELRLARDAFSDVISEIEIKDEPR